MTLPVRTAVILAAGLGSRLGDEGGPGPKGFLKLGAQPIIEESLTRLRHAGIKRVIIVTGYANQWYDDLAARSNGFVSTVHNPLFDKSGSMYSLYCARDLLDGDFLLLESDLVYERRALSLPLSCPHADCIVLSKLSDSHDEVFVETRRSHLVAMSKSRDRLGSVAGELVGISKISTGLFARMIDNAGSAFDADLMVDYETDCLVSVAANYPLHCHAPADLAWTEIDDARHMHRARTKVYPEILRRDAGKLL